MTAVPEGSPSWLVALGIVTGFAILWRQSRKVTNQVANSHTSNLRDDLDKVISGIEHLKEGQHESKQAQLRHDAEIGGMREDIRHVSKRLDTHIATSRVA